MSTEFRQRGVGEITKMLWRQKWTILLPTLALALAIGFVVWQLPNMYESKTVLTITPPKIASPDMDYSSTATINQRIDAMKQVVLSRSTLEPMVTKYSLYKEERERGASMEDTIGKMIKATDIQLERTDENKVSSFSIAYKNTNPENSRAVTSDLAGKFVDLQLQDAKSSSVDTQEFYKKRVDEVMAKKGEVEKRKLDVMNKNRETLPESAQGLIAQLEGLRTKQETIAAGRSQLGTEKSRMNERIAFIDRQKDLIEETMTREASRDQESLTNPTRTQAYGEMIKQKAALNGKLQNLLKQYKEKHPDVIETKTAIEEVDKQIAELKANATASVSEVRASTEIKKNSRLKLLDIEKEQVRSEIKLIESQIAQQEIVWQQAESEIAGVQSRLDSVPSVSIALEAINREIATINDELAKLNDEKNKAENKAAIVEGNKGETIKMIDPARLPESPTNTSKKMMLSLVGAIGGLFFGLFLAGVFEVRSFFTIQNLEDVKHYTNLPVLAAVPEMLTPQELRKRWSLAILKFTIGLAIAVGMIPMLIFALQKLRILEKFAL